MQILGLLLLTFIVWFGFRERGDAQISAFDLHALIMVVVGSASAVLVSSSRTTALRTVLVLRELLPGGGRLKRETAEMEAERDKVGALWREGKRSAALEEGAASSSTTRLRGASATA